ncbi:uncharacterized protein BO66DRAFT_242507 [Aspergillus aculeatinus CBS 121060]|uniref:Uncharacterized protein n=1 Tax=Aspergillus aculeatinus CBS 121060 TaxID=1448322 RepID=A0ACD1GSG2_9EURO|nr:hypothetical protein BO66DRAFT_242507 [Aspergillus aculeatinus CBS 121060]RAH64392.1 hypothetical protein BO66DRAFT_242507 [Aspergillus aculeatinus CBS 121060]
MSFGFGVGDFLATLQLADNLKKRFAQAPSGFKAISADVKSLWAVLHDLDDIPKDGLSATQKAELDVIVQRGREVLMEIEGKLSKYNVLAYTASDWKSKATRAWSRVKWDPVEVDSLRNRITYCLSLWNLVMSKMNQYIVLWLSLGGGLATDHNADRDLTADIGAEVHAMKDTHDAQLHIEMLAWISPIDTSERQRKSFDIHGEGTGRWFLESEQFVRWISSDAGDHALLCTGAPGAGKTILTSITIDYLQKKHSHKDGIVIVYHYFHYQEQLGYSDILSSFLRQLVQANPGLHEIIARKFPRRWRAHNRLTGEQVQETLKLALVECNELIYVIDALDECSDLYVRRQLLAWVRDTLKPNGRTKGRFLATARHGDHFGKFSPGNVTCLEIEASRGDVESFLDGNVTYLPEFLQGKPELWKYIRHQIIESAGGIFLLVRLYYTLLLDEKNEKGVRALG